MKKTLFTLAALLALLAGQVQAQTIIHYWSFNGLQSPNTGPVNPNTLAPIFADTSATGSAVITYRTIAGTSAAYTSYYAPTPGDTLNSIQAAPAGKALGLQNTDSMEARFYVPAGGYKDVVFKFGGETDSIYKNVSFSYSIDSGITWQTSGIRSINGNASTITSLIPFWALNIILFDNTVDNQNRFVIRAQFPGSSNSAAIFDNVTLEGTLMNRTSVANISSASSAITLYPNPASASITINTPSKSEKSIAVYNTTGQAIYSTLTSTQMVIVPVNDLATGLYYVLIHENATGENYTAKFLKE